MFLADQKRLEKDRISETSNFDLAINGFVRTIFFVVW